MVTATRVCLVRINTCRHRNPECDPGHGCLTGSPLDNHSLGRGTVPEVVPNLPPRPDPYDSDIG